MIFWGIHPSVSNLVVNDGTYFCSVWTSSTTIFWRYQEALLKRPELSCQTRRYMRAPRSSSVVMMKCRAVPRLNSCEGESHTGFQDKEICQT